MAVAPILFKNVILPPFDEKRGFTLLYLNIEIQFNKNYIYLMMIN